MNKFGIVNFTFYRNKRLFDHNPHAHSDFVNVTKIIFLTCTTEYIGILRGKTTVKIERLT